MSANNASEQSSIDGDADVGTFGIDDDASLKSWERSAAGLAGCLLAGAGGWAVFTSTNQAGTAALLLVGGALLVIGIQGTPLVRLSGAGNAVELAKRNRRVAVRRATEVVESESQPDRREALAEGAATVEPALRPLAEQVRYGNVFYSQLVGLLPNAKVQRETHAHGFDFLLTHGEGSVAIEVKNVSSRPVSISEAVDQLTSKAAPYRKLVVVNYTPNPEVIDYARGRAVEVVTWRDPRDNEVLQRVLQQLLET